MSMRRQKSESGVRVLTWEDGQMQVRQYIGNRLNGLWNLSEQDKFVLGDFHSIGRDIADPSLDFITDNLTDVFIYNAWGTGMIGFNYPSVVAARPEANQDQLGIIWIILYRLPH